MIRNQIGLFTLCLGLATTNILFSGCGTKVVIESQSQSAPATGKENLKKRLQAVAETGSGGSGLVGLRESLLELKKTEPALADQLLPELTKLERTSNADIIKKVASEMVSKL